MIDGKVDAYDITATLTPTTTEFTTGGNVRSNKSVTVGGVACPPPHIRGDVTYVTTGPTDANCYTGLLTQTTTTLSVADATEPGTNDNEVAGKILPASAYSFSNQQRLIVGAGQTVTLATGPNFSKILATSLLVRLKSRFEQ